MFEYKKTTVINSTKDREGKPMFYHNGDGSVDLFGISRFGEFHKECIVNIFHKAPEEPKLSVFKFKVPATLKKGNYIVSFDTRYYGDSSYATMNAFYEHGFNHSFDFEALEDNEDATAIAKRIEAIVEAYKTFDHDDMEFSIKVNGDEVIFTSSTPYMSFRNAKLVMGEKSTSAVISEFNKYDTKGEPIEVDGSKVENGHAGFGTYDMLVRGVSIPNCNNTKFMGINSDKRPIEGAKYHQYIIDYSVYRGKMGMSVVGQEVTSGTQFSIWVNDAIHSDFEAVIKDSFAKDKVKDLVAGEEYNVEVSEKGHTTKRKKTVSVPDEDDYAPIP